MTGKNELVDAFHTAGAGKILTTSYVAGDTLDPQPSNTLRLACTLAGADTTTNELQVEWSNDGSTWFPLDVVDGVSSGVVTSTIGVWQILGTIAAITVTVAVPPGVHLRVKAKRTDGDGTSTLLVQALRTVE